MLTNISSVWILDTRDFLPIPGFCFLFNFFFLFSFRLSARNVSPLSDTNEKGISFFFFHCGEYKFVFTISSLF